MKKKILHLILDQPDSLAQAIIAAQQAEPGNEVAVADFTGPNPDYARAVELIFESDSVTAR